MFDIFVASLGANIGFFAHWKVYKESGFKPGSYEAPLLAALVAAGLVALSYVPALLHYLSSPQG